MRGGWEGFNRSVDVKITWRDPGAEIPFDIILRECLHTYSRLEGDIGYPRPYETFRDGTVARSFPFTPRWNRDKYAIADGTTSLDSLSRTLAAYSCDWTSANWVTTSDREDVLRRWRQELQRVNSRQAAHGPIAKGLHIIVPDEDSVGGAIFNAVEQAHREGNASRG
jgi:hypothetical protein